MLWYKQHGAAIFNVLFLKSMSHVSLPLIGKKSETRQDAAGHFRRGFI